MISYVECLGGDGAGPGVSSRCWNSGPDEERDQLLPCKMAALQPKTEGSLRRRLLSAKIHQHHNAIYGIDAGGAGWPGGPSCEKMPLPPHPQYAGPWFQPQPLPPRPHVHPPHPPQAHGKLLLAPDVHGKHNPQSLQMPRPVLTQRRRTSSCPPTPEPRPGYTFPHPSPLSTTPPLRESEVPPQYCYRPSRGHKTNFFCLKWRGRSTRQDVMQTTPLLHRGTAI